MALNGIHLPPQQGPAEFDVVKTKPDEHKTIFDNAHLLRKQARAEGLF